MDTFELHSKQPPRSSAGSSCANTPPLPPPPSMSIQTPLPFPGSGSLQPRHGPRFIFPTVSPARQVPRTPSTRMPVPSFQSFLAQNSPRSRDLSASHSSPLHLGHSASSVVSSASSSSPLRDHVLIVNEDGTETSAEVVPNIENTNKKTRKQGRPNKVSISEYLLRFRTFVLKEEENPAKGYYVKMLEMQTQQMELRGKLLKEKLILEQLKQRLIRRKLATDDQQEESLQDESSDSNDDEEDLGDM